MTNKVTTVRFHIGGDDEIKTEHNRREESTVKWEPHIDMEGKHEVLRDMSIEETYEELFGRAIEEYDAKQKRRDRRIGGVHEYMEQVQELYKLLLDLGVANEDARMILPNACCTRMMVTMNIRALLHFFQLRCCQRAQQEIRDMAYAMLKECKKVSPILFKHAGPTCVKGYCPEGSMSCGRAPTLDMLIKSYKEHH